MPISGRMKRTSNCVGVIIDESKKGFKGRVYNCFDKEPQHFDDINELFYIVESVMDALNFPALKTKCRQFKKTESTFVPKRIDVEKQIIEPENLLPDMEKEGYVIMVTGRDNATWQGSVYNKSKDEEVNFNSEVELIKYLSNQ